MSIDEYRKKVIFALNDFHPESDNFKKQVKTISEDFAFWRNCRTDGNCFYRATGVALLEHFVDQRTDVKVMRGFYNNLLYQQFRIEDLDNLGSVLRAYKVTLKVLYSLLKFKQSHPGYLPHLIDKLVNSEAFMVPYISVLRYLAYLGACKSLSLQGLLEASQELVADILNGHPNASEADITGLSYALSCSIVQIELGNTNFEVVRSEMSAAEDRPAAFQIFILLENGHYSTLLRK